MKNLKKVLALALVVVMVFGIMVTASAKLDAYTDADKINYTEAVDLLSGIGVLEGMTSTTFEPQGDLTREQAAKVITYLAVGSTAAEAMKAVAAPFDDVAANRWSAGYIAYCVNEGIINGRGDGTFAPTDKVTGLEFAKMLLCLIGYGEKDEFIGDKWAVEVAKIALQNDIFVGNLAGASNDPATREEAALYAFNALFVDNVRYSSLLDEYTTGSIIGGAGGAYGTIAGNVFKITKDDKTVNGVYGYTYQVNGQDVSGFYSAEKVVGTSTDGTSIANLTDPTKNTYIATLEADATYYVNGVVSNSTAAEAAIKVGSVVELINSDNDNRIEKVMVTNKSVATVSSIRTTTTGTVTNVNITTDNGIITGTAANVVGFSGLERGDVILYYTEGTGATAVTYIETPKSVTGTIGSYNTTANTVTVSGVSYKVSGLSGSDTFATLTGYAGVDGAVFYLDNGNNIVKVVSDKAAVTLDNVVFLTAVEKVSSLGVDTYRAAALFMDGSTKTIVVSRTAASNGTLTAVNSVNNSANGSEAGTDGALLNNHFYTFTVNADSTYSLTYAANTVGNLFANIDGGKALFVSGNGYIGDSATRFVYQNDTTKAVTTYTGVSTAPDYKVNAIDADGRIHLLMNDNGTVMAVVALGGVPGTGATASTDKVFVVGSANTVWSATGTYYTYAAYVNGEYTDAFATDNASLKAGTLYDVSAYTGTLATTVAVATGNATDYVDSIRYSNGTMTLVRPGQTPDMVGFILSSDVVVYLYDSAEKTVTTISPEMAAELTLADAVVYTVPVSATNPAVAAVYINM